MAHLRIGSRGSQLALWQADHVRDALRAQGHSVDVQIIKTTGDKILDVPLSRVGTKGMFTKEIEEALAAKKIDLAVHSLKDLPTESNPGFEIAAVLKREDARDAFVSTLFESIDALPKNARVGTSSLRRTAQLRALRPDVDVQSLRGNVDTRLKKLEAGDYDAIVLAHAGLLRLGRAEHVRQVFEPATMCPAAGQGALAIQIRKNDNATHKLLTFLDDPDSRATTEGERCALNALGGGCQVPIGAHAYRTGNGGFCIYAVVARPDGSEILRADECGPDPRNLGMDVGLRLFEMGAREILADVYKAGLVATPEQP
jgi:hydroxymethylbilane synthase